MKSSPLNELTAQDIARKQKKLDRINKRIERKDDKFKAKVSSGKKGTDMDITRHERSLSGLKERKHKTEHQIKTGERGRPTSLRNEEWLAGTSRKSSSPVNNLTEGDEIVSSAEGSANYRKSALNMLGVKSSPLNDMTEQENVADDFEAQWAAGMAGQEDVDVGSATKTKRSKKIEAIKKDVSEWDPEKNKLALPKEHDYFVANPTEDSDKMAVRIQDAKDITKADGPYPTGITTRGEHFVKVEKPLQEELSEKMLLKNRGNK